MGKEELSREELFAHVWPAPLAAARGLRLTVSCAMRSCIILADLFCLYVHLPSGFPHADLDNKRSYVGR